MGVMILMLTLQLSNTGEISVVDIPRPKREHKGSSLLLFPENYVVIDIETTGLDPRFDEIIELAGIKYANGSEVARFQTLVNAEVDEFITELTGITNEMLKDAPDIRDALPRFLAFIGDNPVVGHNINFDVNFIYDCAEYLQLPAFSNDFVDTMRISRKLYKDMENHKLSTLVSYLCIEDNVEHRALSDCICAQQCFAKMKDYADQIGGIPQSLSFSTLARHITAETTDFNEDSPIFGMTFAFTGRLERMTRKEAMQAVVNAGGICVDGVTAATNYLVLGVNDYCKSAKGTKTTKQKKAERMQCAGANIATISENTFYDMLEM